MAPGRLNTIGAWSAFFPASGGVERQLLPSDNINLVIPVVWGDDGEIVYVTRESRARTIGMRDIWLVPARGGSPRHVGVLPGECWLNINVLRGGKEASCHTIETKSDAWILSRLPH